MKQYIKNNIKWFKEAKSILKQIVDRTFTGSLGDRMKFYESLTRSYIPKNSHYIIRVDGRAFSKYTRSLDTPFDADFIDTMNQVAVILCQQISGAQKAFVQSDEISIHITDTASEESQHWFGGKIDKILGISAVIASNAFNSITFEKKIKRATDNIDYTSIVEDNISFNKKVQFDSRVILLPNEREVDNCMLWRMQDCKRNSIQSVGQKHFSSKQLKLKNTAQVRTMVKEAGHKPWEAYDDGEKYGRLVVKEYDENTNRTDWVVKNNELWVSFK